MTDGPAPAGPTPAGGAAAGGAAGGPATARREAARPGPTGARRALVLAALVAVCVASVGLGWASKARCLDDGAWQDGEQFAELCYTDVAILWFGRGLADGQVPYLDADLEYPVLLGGLTWGLATATRAAGGGILTFLGLNALAAAALAVAILVALRALGVRDGRLWWWAASPPLVLYALLNWDLLALALLVGAIVAHVRGRDATAGALAGLGTAAKLFPALLIPAVVVGHLRAGQPRRAVRHAGWALAAWAAVNLPVAVASPSGWWRFYEMSMERSANPASLWTALDVALRGAVPAGAPGVASPVALVVGTVAILVVGARRLPPAESWRLVLPLVAWFLVANKVHSPQFDLWVVPLALLVLPRLAPLAAFLAVDLVVVVVEFRHLGGRAGALPAVEPEWLAAVVLLRAAALGWIIVASLRPALTARSTAAAGHPRPTPTAPNPATAGAGRRHRPAPSP